MSDENRIRLIATQPIRGRILDKNGIILADSRVKYSLILKPQNVRENAWEKNMEKLWNNNTNLENLENEKMEHWKMYKLKKYKQIKNIKVYLFHELNPYKSIKLLNFNYQSKPKSRI